jgi:hypothetical protein
LVIILLPASAFFILKSSKVQTYITQKITQEISKNLNAKFQIESVNFKFFNRLVLENVYVEDQQQDTLLFSKKLVCNIRKIDRKNHTIEIQKINLIDAKFYLQKFDTIHPINLTCLIRSASKNDTTRVEKEKWLVNLKNIELNNTTFQYNSVRKKKQNYGVNLNDLYVNIKKLEAKNLEIKDGFVDFYVKNLECKEKSGFQVYRMNFFMSIGNEHMIFKNLNIRTPQSFINADSVCFYQKDYYDYDEFAKNVTLDFALLESNISFKDIGYFAPRFRNIDLNAVISGRVYSKLSSFKGKNLKIHIGEQTELITNFNLNGLPDYRQMFIFVDFKKLTTWAKDFELFNKFIKKGNKISIPENFEKLGIISYKGNFAGFFDNFVTYGKFTSDLGNVSTDLSLQPDTSKTLKLNGSFKTKNFQIGELSGYKDIIGKLSMSANINGSISKKAITAKTEGIVDNFEINNYNYQDIKFDGFLTEKTYNGIFSITDPNIQMNFSGGIDFSQEIPEFNFYANVPKARLHELNIDKNDSTSFLSFDLETNFKGLNIDNAIGEIKVNNASLIKFNDVMEFNNLYLFSENVADTQKLELKSDYIDGVLIGKYKSSTLIQSLKNLYFNYVPSFINDPNDTIKIDIENNFSLDLKLKKTNLISKFFIPSLVLSDSSSLKLDYNATEKSFQLNANFDKLRFKNHIFQDLNVTTYSNDTLFTTLTKCSSLLLNSYFLLDNFRTASTVKENFVNSKIGWDNKDTTVYKGDIFASAQINQAKDYDDPSFKITIEPSEIIVKNSLWNINKSDIKIDSTSLKINDFIVHHENQYFNINGEISENPNDTLFIKFSDLDLANVNVLTQKNKLEFNGIINGDANISNLYNSPLFYSEINIDNLILNNQEFGFTQIQSNWDKDKKAIDLNVSTLINNKETISVKGNYFPSNKNILVAVKLNQLNTNVISPYLKSFASEITGITDGNALITGTLSKPIFNGNLYFQNTSMKIDYINTPYYFTTQAKIQNNSIVFINAQINDSYKNIALTNGYVKFGPNKNISYNFNINAENIHSLNTSGINNNAFYGTAFMTGIVNIVGDKQGTFMDILGITEPNTKINIPLTKSQSAEKSGFLSFTNKSNTVAISNQDLDISTTNFQLNFDLEITPDADAQLIFDSKIGDVIRGNGAGNIKMEIDANNNFKMLGEYVIEQGDYLFTLQNVINKKFKIQRGGNIVWNGEPYNANVNIEAAYNLKTSLSGLVDSSYYNTSDYYKKRIPVECQVFLTDKLMNPNISFNINLPTADEETKTLVRSLINTAEKQNKQFLSLLVLNTFMPEQSSDNYLSTPASTANIGTVTTSELLSNQLSHWLSQISDEWDIGVNYRPGDEITKDQVEVALSTQLLNDRVSINGNVGYGGQTTDQASNLVGDFNLDVKINKSGKLRFKAFNESNDKLIYENAPYTQGVGIFYREEFNYFSELLRNFWHKFGKNKKDSTKD